MKTVEIFVKDAESGAIEHSRVGIQVEDGDAEATFEAILDALPDGGPPAEPQPEDEEPAPEEA